jgi:ankyrin repeat protein
MRAATEGNSEVCSLLLDRGADIAAKDNVRKDIISILA